MDSYHRRSLQFQFLPVHVCVCFLQMRVCVTDEQRTETTNGICTPSNFQEEHLLSGGNHF